MNKSSTQVYIQIAAWVPCQSCAAISLYFYLLVIWQPLSLFHLLKPCNNTYFKGLLDFELIFFWVFFNVNTVLGKIQSEQYDRFKTQKQDLFYSKLHISDTFLSALLTPTYVFTFLHGSGCCIRTMPYSTPKTVRVITVSHLHPVALCSYYQIFHLHRACPNMEISTTFLQTAKYDVATLTQKNKETIRVEERRRADPHISGLQKGSYEKTWLEEKTTQVDSVWEQPRKQKGNCV